MLIINGFTYESGRKNFPDFQIQIFSHFFSGLVFSGIFFFVGEEGIIFFDVARLERFTYEDVSIA